MRDGVELATKITMPDAEGRFPAVMMYHPYRGVREPLPDYRDERPMLVPYLAERGYAIVQYDVRGTGNSGGWSKDIYSDDERRDGYEMVEWIARQALVQRQRGHDRNFLRRRGAVAGGGPESAQPQDHHRALGQRQRLYRVDVSRRLASTLHVRHLFSSDDGLQLRASRSRNRR